MLIFPPVGSGEVGLDRGCGDVDGALGGVVEHFCTASGRLWGKTGDTAERNVVHEGIDADGLHSGGKDNALQVTAMKECALAESLEAGRKVYVL